MGDFLIVSIGSDAFLLGTGKPIDLTQPRDGNRGLPTVVEPANLDLTTFIR